MFCVNCGKTLSDDFKLCPYCGTSVLNGIIPNSNNGFDIRDSVLVKYTGRASHIIVPDGVKIIGKYAFCEEKHRNSYNCQTVYNGNEYVEEITLPNSVTKIEKYAFAGCISLKNIILPDSILTIGEYAFAGCISLKNIILPDSILTIGEYAFSDCKSLSSVVLPKKLTIIERFTFYKCEKLDYVDIPQTLTEIKGNAFLITAESTYSPHKSCPLRRTMISDSVIMEKTIHEYSSVSDTTYRQELYGGLSLSEKNEINNRYLKIYDLKKYRLKNNLCIVCGCDKFTLFGKCKNCGHKQH